MTDKESPLADIYTLLGVSQMSPMEGVRTQFYKLTRLIHRELAVSTDIDRRNKLLYDLKFICIAYDILSDPVTRTDYDLRTMGLRGVSMPQTPEEKKPGELGQRLHLKIGELLNVAGLLEASELEIACDMHKAMPEMQFGSFLVKQGFIEEYQLEAVLFAQKLLRKGLITVVQYQAAMEELESSGVGVSETVVERGYVTQSDLDHLEEVEAEAEAELNRPTEAPVYKQPPLQPKPDEQVTSHSNLLAQMLPPGSPEVVSARAGGNGEKAAPSMLHKLLSGTQDGDVTAPPTTMKDMLKAGAQAAQAEVKEHKDPKESGRKKKITAEEMPVDPNLGLGTDIASDTYEGVAYREDLLKPVDAGPALWTVASEPAAGPDETFMAEGDGPIGADNGENAGEFGEIMAPAPSDSAPGDELGLIDAESSGVEFQGFVDQEETAHDEDQDDEDEEEEDEGNITLIDADAAQLLKASLPAADSAREAQLIAGSREKTDATHERIPAYARSERLETDTAGTVQAAPPAEALPEAASSDAAAIAQSIREQSTTRDKIPVFKPPLHNTFQLDADASQSSEDLPGEEEAGDAAERQLVISNAVPSNYQLDWSSPEGEEQAQPPKAPPHQGTASQESEPIVDISRHIDLEAIEPQQKTEGDDELNTFLGEQYKEDLAELNESGKPLWDVEDDEFIMPSGQKRQKQQAEMEESDSSQAKEKRVSGGWQRLKNPFELQLDSQPAAAAAGGTSAQSTGDQAVVEVDEQAALENSRSATADIDRNALAVPAQSADEADAPEASTDRADSHEVPRAPTSGPQIVIGLEDAGAAGEERAPAEELSVEPPASEAEAEAEPPEQPSLEIPVYEDTVQPQEQEAGAESKEEPLQPAASADTEESGTQDDENTAGSDEDEEDSTAGDGKSEPAASGADAQETPLARRRRMLGRRHHRGKP